METTAVVVARKGSVRLKSKSMLKLDEKQTLIERKIKQLQQCKRIHRVVFGSDCEIMREVAKSAGAQIVERPQYYCDESKASANEMIANMLSLFHTDIVVWAHCTNPLITPDTYDKAIETFFDNLKQFDSLLSVVELKEHLWKSDKSCALNYNPFAPKHTPAKELAPLYMQDGGIFIQPYEQMRANSYFFGKKPYLFEIPKDEFLDINEMRDYLLAKALIQACKGGGEARTLAIFLFACYLALFVYSKYNTFDSLFNNILSLKIKSKVVSTHLYSALTSLKSKIPNHTSFNNPTLNKVVA
ncbi:cytidylyltransferase domain-containing protein [Helicobacter himalayensis]|uniref:acylneuraminate cytidylyltransferase family protein n=1 Tax=Helicobacter himalayensis TaxID=1591088 RepID=UPI003D6DEAF5